MDEREGGRKTESNASVGGNERQDINSDTANAAAAAAAAAGRPGNQDKYGGRG